MHGVVGLVFGGGGGTEKDPGRTAGASSSLVEDKDAAVPARKPAVAGSSLVRDKDAAVPV